MTYQSINQSINDTSISKTLQNNISFFFKVQMVKAKRNFYFSLPVYSLISMKIIKYENVINNQLLQHTTYPCKN